jgi:hypothetical protein
MSVYVLLNSTVVALAQQADAAASTAAADDAGP